MHAVFLDRDGVINENRPDHVKAWDEFSFIPGSLDAMRLLSEAGYVLFIVTNQAIINRGLVPAATVEQINRRLVAIARHHGALVSDLRYCPHREDESCACRKPAPGMLLSLAAAHRVDPRRAVIVGDALSDIAAGQAFGCRTVLVTTGRGAEQLPAIPARKCYPDFIARDLAVAAQWIVAEGQLAQRAVGEYTPIGGAALPEPVL